MDHECGKFAVYNYCGYVETFAVFNLLMCDTALVASSITLFMFLRSLLTPQPLIAWFW